MEAKIFRDTMECAVKLCDTKTEVSLETEIMIPDYLPQVFKIVKCFIEPVILQKQPSTARLTIDGYLRCVAFYQAEQEQKLCTTEQKVPFTKTIELPEHQADWISVSAMGETEYLNCRAVNQRRIDVRGACVLHVKAFAQESCEAVTAVSDAGMEQKMESIQAVEQVAVCDKVITAEENIQFDQTPETILRIDGDATLQEIKLICGKAVVKGEIRTKVLYVTAAAETVTTEKNVPFSQILDLEGVDEECEAAGWMQVTGCALMAGSPENGEVLSATAILHLQVWKKNERSVVSDVFSTFCKTEQKTENYQVTQNVEKIDTVVQAVCAGQLPDEGAQIIACMGTVCPPETVPTETGFLIRGRAVAHIICLNSLGELECYDRACEYQTENEWKSFAQQPDLDVCAVLQSVSASKDGENASAKMNIHLCGTISDKKAVKLLTDVSCGEEWEENQSGVALRIYYACAGEDIFDIARKYHASPADILQAAGMDQMVLEQSARLLIPVTN